MRELRAVRIEGFEIRVGIVLIGNDLQRDGNVLAPQIDGDILVQHCMTLLFVPAQDFRRRLD